MRPTFDFGTCMAVALGSAPERESSLLWIDIGGALLLAAREDVMAGWGAGADEHGWAN